jgi:hypothetical protein
LIATTVPNALKCFISDASGLGSGCTPDTLTVVNVPSICVHTSVKTHKKHQSRTVRRSDRTCIRMSSDQVFRTRNVSVVACVYTVQLSNTLDISNLHKDNCTRAHRAQSILHLRPPGTYELPQCTTTTLTTTLAFDVYKMRTATNCHCLGNDYVLPYGPPHWLICSDRFYSDRYQYWRCCFGRYYA